MNVFLSLYIHPYLRDSGRKNKRINILTDFLHHHFIKPLCDLSVLEIFFFIFTDELLTRVNCQTQAPSNDRVPVLMSVLTPISITSTFGFFTTDVVNTQKGMFRGRFVTSLWKQMYIRFLQKEHGKETVWGPLYTVILLSKNFDSFVTMKGCRHSFMKVFILGFLLVDFASSNCTSDDDCLNGQVCCGGYTCLSKASCHCEVDRHCNRGEKCVNWQCVTDHESHDTQSCHGNNDCRNNNRYRRCCNGKCEVACSGFSTTQPTPELPCIGSRECRDDEKCEDGKCVKDDASSRSRNTLSKAGFLSAAILTGSVFLLIMCCCFVRESKLGRRRYIERQRRRSRRSRNRRRSSDRPHSSVACGILHVNAVENRSFNSDNVNRDGGLFFHPPSYPGEFNSSHTGADVVYYETETQVSPPPYHTLSFLELPPPYEEAFRGTQNCGSLAPVS